MWIFALVFVVIGLLTIRYRHLFRNSGPAGIRPMFDKKPTSRTEQLIVAGIGAAFVTFGVLMALDDWFGILNKMAPLK